MKFIQATLDIISLCVNKAMSLDPEFIEKLAVLEGKVIHVNIQGFDLLLSIRINATGIAISKPSASDKADVVVSGPPFALFGFVLAQDSIQVFQEDAVRIEGNVQLVRQFEQLMGKLDMDWEEVLAQSMGDVPAHYLGKSINQACIWTKRVHQSLITATSEYLQEEARQLPTRVEVDHFLSEIDVLCDAVERFEIRIINI